MSHYSTVDELTEYELPAGQSPLPIKLDGPKLDIINKVVISNSHFVNIIGVAIDTGWLSFPDYTSSVRVKVGLGLGLVRVWVGALTGGNSVILTTTQTIIATGDPVTIAVA